MSVVLETSLGVAVVDLYLTERKNTCLNFLKLCKLRYFNNCLFHSVQKGLVAQTGDPTGTGSGGESVFKQLYGDQAVYFDKETLPIIKHSKKGLLSMVNNGHDMHGSQFFITLGGDLDYLDSKHTVFGELSEGLDIIELFNGVYTDQEGRPYKNVRLHHTIVVYDPFPDPRGLDPPDRSPIHVPNIQLPTEPGVPPRIEEDEVLDETEGLTAEELAELEAEKAAKANAKLLTLIGDIPDADIKPPENVLFVCKLNPITTSEDLEIIFSRFGDIVSCEVIRDRRSGNSLQYAFVEYEKEESCQNAFLKMDNVIIDDRRIHVDFSQSVAKEWQKIRQGGDDYRPRVPILSARQRGYKSGHKRHRSQTPPQDNRHHRSRTPPKDHRRRSRSPRREKGRQRSRTPTGHRYRRSRESIPSSAPQPPRDKPQSKDIMDKLIDMLQRETASTRSSSSSSSSSAHHRKEAKKAKKKKKKSKKSKR